jgi:predicted nucleotidyltransferase
MRLWSVSTTVRNPERIRSFLKFFKELEGKVWNDESQRKYQVLLIQHKLYGFNNTQFEKTLSPKQLKWFHSENFTYKQVEEILAAKKYVGGGDMRGRQSFNALEKLGLACLNTGKKNKNYFFW